jgi:predicted transcriptional regulator
MYVVDVHRLDASMVRTQIYLTREQQGALERLASATGRRKSDLIREALDGYLARRRPGDWKEALRACAGMWADRDDVADLHERTRRESDERLKRLWGKS